jgi:thiol-disulfide isomerase/thioredoxin
MANILNRFIRTSWLTYLLIGILIIITVWCLVYYYRYIYQKTTSSFRPDNELSLKQSGGGSAEILFFFADWCPHCKSAKPIWTEIKNEYQNNPINNYTVIFTEIDCSNEDDKHADQMMSRYNVEGFPTIKLIKDGQVMEFDAKPTKDNLTKFLHTVV